MRVAPALSIRRESETASERAAGRQADRRTDRHTDRQTDRQQEMTWTQLFATLLIVSGVLGGGGGDAPREILINGRSLSSFYNLTDWLARPHELGNIVGMFVTSEKNEPLLEVAGRLLRAAQFKNASNTQTIGEMSAHVARYVLRQLPDWYEAGRSEALQGVLDAIEAELQHALQASVDEALASGALHAADGGGATMYDWTARALRHVRPLGIALATLRQILAILPRPEGVSETCFADVLRFADGLLAARDWALTMMDAWGKPLAGSMEQGSLEWLGNRDECDSIVVKPEKAQQEPSGRRPSSETFKGKYCIATFGIPRELIFLLPKLRSIEYVKLGVCLPSSCRTTDFTSLLPMQIQCEGNHGKMSRLATEEEGYCTANQMDNEGTC